jgi:hypothetical protein
MDGFKIIVFYNVQIGVVDIRRRVAQPKLRFAGSKKIEAWPSLILHVFKSRIT